MQRRQHVATAAGVIAVAMAFLASETVQAGPMLPLGTTVAATSGSPYNPCGTAQTAPPTTYQHVIWIWMEDNALSKVIGNAAAPYITGLAGECGYAKGWLDDVINGASNYVPGVAGANCNSESIHATAPPGDVCITEGMSPAAKCTVSSCKNTVAIPSIFEQLQDVGDSWKAYEESMPFNCDTSNTTSKTAPYYVRHNPAPYLSDLRIAGKLGGNTCQTNDVAVPTTSCTGTSCAPNGTSNPLFNDLNNNTLPSFSFVTPNACNNMHNKCTPYANRVTNGDQWLSAWLPIITSSPAYQSGTTAVFIMWDEGSFGSVLPNVVVAPTVVPGTVVPASTTMDNIAALGTTEKMLGLGNIGCATGLSGDGSPCPSGATTNLRTLFNI